MNFNKSPLSFDDIREAFDRALATLRGIKIPCETRGAAVLLRSRFNYFRTLNRKENRDTYPPGHQMYGRSIYDKLVLRIPPRGSAEEAVLYVEPRSVEALNIQEII